jgi:hypothetical protein
MDRKLLYHQLFRSDVIDAAQWYSTKSERLGDAFLERVSQATRAIIVDPESHSRMDSRVRYRQIERFPYIIVFEVTDDSLFLAGVIHTARSLDSWWQSRHRNP